VAVDSTVAGKMQLQLRLLGLDSEVEETAPLGQLDSIAERICFHHFYLD